MLLIKPMFQLNQCPQKYTVTAFWFNINFPLRAVCFSSVSETASLPRQTQQFLHNTQFVPAPAQASLKHLFVPHIHLNWYCFTPDYSQGQTLPKSHIFCYPSLWGLLPTVVHSLSQEQHHRVFLNVRQIFHGRSTKWLLCNVASSKPASFCYYIRWKYSTHKPGVLPFTRCQTRSV